MARALAGDDGGAGGDWQLGCAQVRERGARLLASGQWADCSFRPGAGQRAAPVKAHRLILAMASPVFQAMLYGPLAEGDAPIPVPDVQPDVFNKLLQYVYTDDTDLENNETAIEVYYAADKYMLPHLQVLCNKYLKDNLVPQNACGIYEFANFIEDKELESKSLMIIQDNTKQALAPDSSFEDLALGTAIHIFSLNRLTIDSELDLLAAAERYVVLAWQKRINEKAKLNKSSSDVDSENVSTSNRIDKIGTNKVDIIKCNGNSNGDIENHDEKISNDAQDEDETTAKNQEITLSDTKVRERGARLLASGQWADCSFRPGPGQHAAPVKAHRLILAMASPVFQAMLYGPLAEGDAPIPVPDIQPDVFNKLLKYVYTDEVDLENYKTAIEVHYAADKYMLPHLQALCTKYLTDNLVPQNACGIYEFANFIEDKELESKSLKIVEGKTKQALAPGSSFEDLALGTAIHIFSLPWLTIDSELDLLAAAERYVLAQQKGHHKMADSKTSSPEDIPENGSVANSVEKDSNKGDTVECNPSNQQQPLACLDSKMGYDNARSEATFRFTVHNIRNLKDCVLSPPCYVRNLPWKIMVMPRQSGLPDSQQLKSLGFFLQCNGESESSSWSCYATAELRLISHKPNTEPLYKKIQHLFFSKENDWGFASFLEWNKVLDPDMGYIKDESITLEVHVTADAPDGVTNVEPAVVPACPEVVNKARSEATFRFTFNNVSKIDRIVLSPPFYVRNLPWKIRVRPVDDEGQKYLGFYVTCNEGSKSITWSCEALIEGRLISHKPNIEPYYRSSGKYRCFSCSDSVNGCWGYPYFEPWNDVLDPKKGYVKDDAITLEVHVIAEPPQGLSWHTKECIGDVDIEGESVRALLRPIRFLTLTGEQMSEYEPKLSLLTYQDILAIMMNISSEKAKKPMPKGFSKCRIRRTRRE